MGGLSQAATETPTKPNLPPSGAGGFFLGTIFGVGSKDSGPLQSFLAENPRQKPARAQSSAPHPATNQAHGSVYRERTPGVLTVCSQSNWPAALRPLLPRGLDRAPGGPTAQTQTRAPGPRATRLRLAGCQEPRGNQWFSTTATLPARLCPLPAEGAGSLQGGSRLS